MNVKANGLVDLFDKKAGKIKEFWPVDAREALQGDSQYVIPTEENTKAHEKSLRDAEEAQAKSETAKKSEVDAEAAKKEAAAKASADKAAAEKAAAEKAAQGTKK